MRNDAEAGFTLVEVLVALVMAALLTAILLDGATQARRRLTHAEDQRRAVFLARTLMAQAMASPVEQNGQEGSTNGFDWVVAEQILLPDPRGQYGLIGYHVAVSRSGRQMFAADGRRLKRMPAA